MTGKITPKMVCGMALLATLFLAAPALADQANPETLPDSVYMAPQELVPVAGGRRLNLFCMGTGAPTVLLDAGHGESMVVWRAVQGQVARFTRACAYDRAGFGFSDPPVAAPDAAAAVADIHALLGAGKIATPILYAGHSMAGLYGVLLQALHPEDVAGEVLVDPAFAGQARLMMADLPAAVQNGAIAMYQARLAHMQTCAAKAQTPPLPENCREKESGPAALGPELAALQQRQTANPAYLNTNAGEYAAFLPGMGQTDNERILDAHPARFGDKPLIILTHDHMTYPGVSPEQNAQIEKAWRAGHDRLAALSAKGVNRVVPGSGHYIQIGQPGAVVDAIREAVMAMREK